MKVVLEEVTGFLVTKFTSVSLMAELKVYSDSADQG